MRCVYFCLTVVLSAFASTTVGDWSGKIHVDPMTDERIVVLSTYNSADLFAALFLGRTDIPELVVLFNENSDVPIIGVGYNKYVGLGGRTSACQTRFDSDPMQEYPVVIENSNNGIIFVFDSDNAARLFYANLLQGSEVLVRFVPAGQSQITTSFSLSGVTGVSREMGIDVNYYLELNESQDSTAVIDYEYEPQ